MRDNDLMVSIGMTCYNQENYVAQAIESILMQKVNFKYELVIAEDCSTDRTREIVKKYANRYPNIIKLILQERNVGLKKQSLQLKKMLKGKYRSHIEGDDFWVDENRLQKQIDFLELHKEYVGVGGKLFCIDENNKQCKFIYGDLSNVYSFKEDYDINEFQKWLLPSHICSLTYRNIFADCDEKFLNKYESYDIPGDRKTALLLLSIGNIKMLPDCFYARRMTLSSNTNFTHNMLKSTRHYNVIKWMCNLENMAKDMFGIDINFKYQKRQQWIWALQDFKNNPNNTGLENIIKILSDSNEKFIYLKILNEKCINKLKNKYETVGLKKTSQLSFDFLKKYFKSF